jgi:ribosome-associated translation inhibitor RaiA
MDTLLEVIFRNVRPSFRIRDRIEDYVDKLDRFDDRVQQCRVVVHSPRRSPKKTEGDRVTIHAALSNQEIVINSQVPPHRAHRDAAVAVQGAFEGLMRRLEEVAQARQNQASPKAGGARRRGKTVAAATVPRVSRRKPLDPRVT